ncbi:MAG: hypothetical protein JWO32_1466 [Bacteroidetes bacterium]|nr:hypothetical protein [Bacteroidota bacterium]
MEGGTMIQFYNPSAPLSATNPSNTNIPTFGSGLTLMPNINGGTLTPTFYTTSGGTYWYWSGNAWVNTGGSTGNASAVNIGGCGCKIFNLVGGTGQVYVYNGTGNGTLLTTLPNFNGGGPYDLVTDCNCNFYALNTTTPNQALTLYNQTTGAVMQSWTMSGMPNTSAGGGFAIIGNMVYVKNNVTNGFFIGTMSGSTITFTQVSGFNASPGDFASCPVCNTTPSMAATVSNTGPLTCTQLTVNCVASTTTTPVTYLWSGPGITSSATSPTITVNLAGVYTCTLTSPGCPPLQNVISTTVSGNATAISPSITSSGSITCTNLTVQLSVTPNSPTNTIVWSGPGIISGQGTPSININASGLYSVSITNTVNSCAGTKTINIVNTQAPLTLTVSPLNPVKCSVGAAINHTLSGAGSYTWNPNSSVTPITANTFSVDPSVTTTYTITGSTGVCSGSVVTTVSVIPSPTLSITLSTNSVCAQNTNGSPFTFSATASGATNYTWSISPSLTSAGSSNGVVLGPLNSSAASTIPQNGTITLTGVNGICGNTVSTTILIAPNPTVTISPTATSVCQGSGFTFTANGAQSYTWNPPTGLNTVSGPIVTANTNTSTTYFVTGQAAGCFASVQSSTLTILPTPTITINPASPTVCAGSSVNLTANGASNYTWSPTSGLSTSTGANVSAGPSSDLTYTVLGSLNNCTNTAQVTVSVIPVPNLFASASQATICAGYQTNLSVNGATSFSWSPSATLSFTAGPTVIATPLNTTTYTIVGNNGLCTGSITLPVYVVPLPNVGISTPNTYVCEGTSTTIFATGAQSFSWSPSGTLSSSTGNSVIATPPVSTNYTLIGYNSLGNVTCSEMHSYSIVVVPNAQANISGSVVICEGEKTTLRVSGGNTYSWTPGTGLNITEGPAVIASPSLTTVYSVTSSYDGNCGTSGSVIVTVNPLPTVNAGRDTLFNLDAYKFIKATGTGTLNWIEGEAIWCRVCPETQIMPLRNSCYIILAENEFGCKVTDEVCVEVITDFGVYIPNIITPNGDGLNDVFYVYGYSITDVRVSIFDRWGERLFYSADQTVGWPGTYKGTDCKSDVYVYKIDYKGLDGKHYHKTGHVTINR